MDRTEYINNLRSVLESENCTPEFIEKCCKYSDCLLEKELPVIFDKNHLNLILNLSDGFLSSETISNSYHTFNICSHSKTRIISAPSKKLKKRQRWILDNILYKKACSNFAHGFEPQKSIKTNALIHANNDYAVCMDIKDFFPSIKQKNVESVFLELGYTKSASARLAELCCLDGALPQGAPTSPHLANIICEKLDHELYNLAQKYDCCFTRYADDITFSSKNDIESIIPKIENIILKFGFRVNPNKTSYYTLGKPKFITGLVVQDGRIRVPKKFKRELKKEIYFCKKFGVTNHLNNSKATKFINYREYLYGKAYYIHMIETEEGSKFLEQLDEIAWPAWS